MFYVTHSTSKGLGGTVCYDKAQPGRSGELYLRGYGVDGAHIIPLSRVCEVDENGKPIIYGRRSDGRANIKFKDDASPIMYTDRLKLSRFLGGEKVDAPLYVHFGGKDILIDTELYQAINTDAQNKARYFVDSNGDYVETSKVTPPSFKKVDANEKMGVLSDAKTLFESLATGVEAYDMVATAISGGEKQYFREQNFHAVNGKIYKSKNLAKRVVITSQSDEVGKLRQDVKLNLSGRVVSSAGDVYTLETSDGASVTIEKGVDSIKISARGNSCTFSTVKGTPNCIDVENFDLDISGDSANLNIDVAKDVNYSELTDDQKDASRFDSNNNMVVGLNENGGRQIGSKAFDELFGGLKLELDGKVEGVEVYKESPIFKYDERTHDIIKDPSGAPVIDADIIQLSEAKDDRSVEKVMNLTSDENAIKNAIEEILKLKADMEGWISANDPDLVTKTENANKEIEKYSKILEENLSSSDYTNLLAIIDQYRRGDIFPTFYYDNNGRQRQINNIETVELSTTPPFEFLGKEVYQKIIGNNKIEEKKGKLIVKTNEKANSVAGGFLDAFSIMAQFAFGSGILAVPMTAILLGPMVATLVTSGLIKLGAVIQSKIKQAKINKLTPEKIKAKEVKATKKYVKEKIKEAEKEFKRDMKHAKKVRTGMDALKEQQKITQNFLKTKAELQETVMLVEKGTVMSSFDKITKSIKPQNLYGFAKYWQMREKVKHGEKLDQDTKIRLKNAREKFKYKYKGKGIKKLFAKEIDKIAKESPKHEFLVEHGKLKDRVKHLKKTSAYFMATKTEKKNMIKELKEKNKKAYDIKVTAVDVPGDERAKKKLNKTIEKHTPKIIKDKTYSKKQMLRDNSKRIKQSLDNDYLNSATVTKTTNVGFEDARKAVDESRKISRDLNRVMGDESVLDKASAKEEIIKNSGFAPTPSTPPTPTTTPAPTTIAPTSAPTPRTTPAPTATARHASARTMPKTSVTAHEKPTRPTTSSPRASVKSSVTKPSVSGTPSAPTKVSSSVKPTSTATHSRAHAVPSASKKASRRVGTPAPKTLTSGSSTSRATSQTKSLPASSHASSTPPALGSSTSAPTSSSSGGLTI